MMVYLFLVSYYYYNIIVLLENPIISCCELQSIWTIYTAKRILC